MPEAQPNVEDNVSDKRDADLKTTVESNIKEISVASANKNKNTDFKISKAHTDLSEVNDNAGNDLGSQAKATKKPKMSGKSSSKKRKSNEDEKEDKSKFKTQRSSRNKQRRTKKS